MLTAGIDTGTDETAHWRALLAERRRFTAVIEGDDGVPLALVSARPGDLDQEGHLSYLFVLPHAQQQGHGGVLHDAALDWMRAQAFTTARLRVAVDNAEARRFYERRGWSEAPAGASLDHSHSQLIALPIVPREVRDEVDGARQHYAAKERCVFCDIIRQEAADGRRVIAENGDVVALAPYAPRFPFETWILPKRHQSLFEDAPRHELASLARLLGDILRRMNGALVSPPYNLLIHSAPVVEPIASCKPIASTSSAWR